MAVEHRATKCRACQRIYARRKRRAHLGGAFKRRRYRRRGITQPPADPDHTPADGGKVPTAKALCGARDVHHRSRRCANCRAIWNRRHYRKRAQRSLALGIPLRSQNQSTNIEQPCAICGRAPATELVEDSDVGRFSRFACVDHAAAVQKTLADEVAARLQARADEPAHRIRLVPRSQYPEARAWLEQHFAHAVAAVDARARGPEGAEPDSPLYEIRFASIVNALRAKLSESAQAGPPIATEASK